jgi:hypothetical protein
MKKIRVFLLFVAATVIFFWQFFVKGLIPIPGDLVIGSYYPWLNHKWGYSVGVPVKNPGDPDIVSQYYPWKKNVVNALKNGELPLWERTYYMGVTLIGNVQASIFNPFNLLFFVTEDFDSVWGLLVVVMPFLTLLTMYILLRRWKLSWPASILGSLAYAFSAYVITWIEYNVHGFIFAALPLVFYFIHKAEKQGYRFLLWISPTIAFMVFAGYPQTVYYVVGFSIIYSVILSIYSDKPLGPRFKGVLYLVLSIILGLVLAGVQLIPSFQTLAESIRSLDKVALAWSIEKMQAGNLVTALIPDFFGNPATYNFWGLGVYSTFAFYASLVVLILAVFSIRSWRSSPEVFFLWVCAFFILILSLGTPLTSWIHTISFLGLKGSSAARGLYFWGFAIGALGAYGFDQLKKINSKKALAGFVFPLVLMATASALYILQKTPNNLIRADYALIAFRNTLWPSLVAIFAAAGVFVLHKKTKYAFWFLAILLFIDVYRFGNKYLPYTKKDLIFPKTAAIDFLAGQPKPFRVVFERAELFPQNTWSPYGIESVSGYDILVPKETSDFISYINSGQPGNEYARYVDVRNFDSALLNISDTRYAVILNKGGEATPKMDPKRYKKVFSEGIVEIWENIQNLGRFYTVEGYEVLEASNVYARLLNPDFDLEEKVVLSQDPELGRLGKCQAILLAYRQNSEKVKTVCEDSSILVFSEPYNPDWQVEVNGMNSKLYQANARFMAVVVPKGEATVELGYFPKSLKKGAMISLLGLAVFFYLALRMKGGAKNV